HEREMLKVKSESLATQLEGKQHEVEVKTEELRDMAMELTHRSEFLLRMKKDLETAAASPPGKNRKVIKALIAECDALQQESAGQWKLIANRTEEASGPFLEKLLRRCPKLTPTQLKVATLLRLNLSSKDIARLLFVSKR